MQPGATIMMVNNYLAPYGYKLGPDPASWSACTVGGVVANNSSGMSSGTKLQHLQHPGFHGVRTAQRHHH